MPESFLKQLFSKTENKKESAIAYTVADLENAEKEMKEASKAIDHISSRGATRGVTPSRGKALKFLEEKRKKFYEISKSIIYTEADLKNAERAASEAATKYENTYDPTKTNFLLEDMREKVKKYERIYDALKGVN